MMTSHVATHAAVPLQARGHRCRLRAGRTHTSAARCFVAGTARTGVAPPRHARAQLRRRAIRGAQAMRAARRDRHSRRDCACAQDPRLSSAGRALDACCCCCCVAAARRLAAANPLLCRLALRSARCAGRCRRDAALKLRVSGAGLAGMLHAADRARCWRESVAASGKLASWREMPSARRRVTAARSAQPAQMTLRPVTRWRCSSTRRVARPPSRAWDPAGRAAVAVDCQRPCVEPRTM